VSQVLFASRLMATRKTLDYISYLYNNYRSLITPNEKAPRGNQGQTVPLPVKSAILHVISLAQFTIA